MKIIEWRRRNKPNGIPPVGYLGPAGTTTHSLIDAPSGKDWRHKLETCAVCRSKGSDTVLGCARFDWISGPNSKFEFDAVKDWQKLDQPDSSKECYIRNAHGPGELWKAGVDDWAKRSKNGD